MITSIAQELYSQLVTNKATNVAQI